MQPQLQGKDIHEQDASLDSHSGNWKVDYRVNNPKIYNQMFVDEANNIILTYRAAQNHKATRLIHNVI